MNADRFKVAVLVFVLLGLGFSGCVTGGDGYDTGNVVSLTVECGDAEDSGEHERDDESAQEDNVDEHDKGDAEIYELIECEFGEPVQEFADINFTYSENSIVLHPFALVLAEYFAEGVGSQHPDAIETRAFLVDIDGLGTQGVFAMRQEIFYDFPFPMGRVFYMYGDELFYKNLGPQDAGFVTGRTEKGRLVNLMADGGAKSYTLFILENGVLVEDFTIFTMIYEYFYLFPGGELAEGWWTANRDNRESITEYKFNAIRVKYGLDNFDWQDDTNEILAMTIE